MGLQVWGPNGVECRSVVFCNLNGWCEFNRLNVRGLGFHPFFHAFPLDKQARFFRELSRLCLSRQLTI